MRFFVSILLFLVYSCNPQSNKKTDNVGGSLLHKSPIILSAIQTAPDKGIEKSDTLPDKTRVKEKLPDLELISMSRFSNFPTDKNFNGAPLVQQLEIPKHEIDQSPDTLFAIAIARYESYRNYFPVSIADNFEEGISTEHIHFMPLIFNFQIFDNEYELKPFLVKQVTVHKEPNGQIVAE
ncbi:MAG: hypothetical protein CVU05_15645 [Bacteroidetes bacterium HGW-Bacteroidetes-21]|jgi:hypothetical protein|nr:MAG: hypothetical protein CVU05_15645 [Bacteroidetes bacterium HGW-Bacteroidetes-21]